MARKKASRHAQSAPQNKNLYWMGGLAVVLLIVVVLGGLVLSGGNDEGDSDTGSTAAQEITPQEYMEQFASQPGSYLLLDVRTPDEFAEGHIEGAINISHDELEGRLDEVPQDKPIVVYCHSGRRSGIASEILDNAGYTEIYDLGGLETWEKAGYPMVN